MQWWGENEDKFPNVSKLARKYLAIPASSDPSERVLSHAVETDGGAEKMENGPSQN